MRHTFLTILGIAVLLFKFSSIEPLTDNGFMGVNEKQAVKSVIPAPVYNFFESHDFLIKKPKFVEYDNTKSKKDIRWDDKEGYKGSIDFVLGTLYFMLIVSPIFIFYALVKKMVGKHYEGITSRFSTHEKIKLANGGYVYVEKKGRKTVKEVKKIDKIIKILSIILIIMIIIKVITVVC